MTDNSAERLIAATNQLSRDVNGMTFAPPVTHIYNPLDYAVKSYTAYLNRYGKARKRIVFLGMNPGPWGMAQTGVPFGEIHAVKDWLGIEELVDCPCPEHPKRPVAGFSCSRSEVSGRRLWGLFSERYTVPGRFFIDHFVANYCPLVFMEESGRNRTPDKLPREERQPLFEACDRYLCETVHVLQPEMVVGIGRFAADRAMHALSGLTDELRPVVHRILHPSPASPAANRGWAEQAEQKLKEIGAWK